jgi:ATP-dependent RNA helicase DeaD
MSMSSSESNVSEVCLSERGAAEMNSDNAVAEMPAGDVGVCDVNVEISGEIGGEVSFEMNNANEQNGSGNGGLTAPRSPALPHDVAAAAEGIDVAAVLAGVVNTPDDPFAEARALKKARKAAKAAAKAAAQAAGAQQSEGEVAQVVVAESADMQAALKAETKRAVTAKIEASKAEAAKAESAKLEAAKVEAAKVEAAMAIARADIIDGVRFDDLGLSAPILSAIKSAGYETATPIQAAAIPLLLEGRDVLGQAQTGTGKTAAFALPLLQRIDMSSNAVQVLVLTPTRELAIQVAESFERYASGSSGLRVLAVYGGQDYNVQFRGLDRGVQVVVGTPGRVMDHMRRGSLQLTGLTGLVLDEADEMLNMGFAEDVEWILEQAPAERQIALFSATMPEPIRRIAQKYLRNPEQIVIRQKTATADTIKQRFVVAPMHQKQAVLARILEAEPVDAVLVFVKTKSTTEPLAEYLASHGHRTGALNGDVPQKQRERIVENLKAGKIDVIIATDVAARGLDVQRISHVVNYDLPYDSESYVHRIGRTGRAGRTGNAILFLHPRERHLLRRLEQATRQPIEPMDVPTKRQINERRVTKFHEAITRNMDHRDYGSFTSIVNQYQSKHPDVPMEKIAAALAAMVVGDAPLLETEELQQTSFADRNDRRGHEVGGRERPGRERHGRDDHGREGREPRGRDDRREGAGPKRRRSDENMETFRIEVGNSHKVKPGNIVGAIANETGLGSDIIGRIEIYDDHSTVDMLAGMPQELFQALKEVRLAGRKLNITRASEGSGGGNSGGPAGGDSRPPRKFKKKPRFDDSQA